MPSSWNKGQLVVDKEREAVKNALKSLDDYRAFSAANPKFQALPNGTVLQQISEQEFIEKAQMDNLPDASVFGRQSLMSGWKLAESGAHVMIKMSKDTPYELPENVMVNRKDEGETGVNVTSEAPVNEDEPDDTFPFSDRTFDTFSETIKQLESSGRYDIVGGSSNAYDGAYQLGRLAKIDAGKRLGVDLKHDKESREAFRQNPELQDAAFQAFTEANHETLMRLSGRYRGLSRAKKAEALAVAHLLGSGGAVECLKGTDGKDAFGTSGGKYAQAVRDALG